MPGDALNNVSQYNYDEMTEYDNEDVDSMISTSENQGETESMGG